MFNREWVEPYIEAFKAQPEKRWDEYQQLMEKVQQSKAIYKGKPIPITYQGMFYGKDTIDYFSDIATKMMTITDKVTREYLKNPEYRKLFAFDKRLEDLILLDPGYDMPVPIGRYDIFYNGVDDFKFCEFNTDGSSAMNEDAVLGDLLLETPAFMEYGEQYDVTPFELFESWVKTSLEIYRESTQKKTDHPRVAIVDFIDKGTTNEFIRFKETYEKMGVSCVIADPRELEYRDGELLFQNERIDLVYRRAVTMDLMEKWEEIPALIEAYRDRSIVMIGSFRSQIMHSKLIFKILRHPMTRAFLEEAEYNFLTLRIPYTEEFKTEEDFQRVRLHKNNYILKPNEGYASYGVFAGREHTQIEWEKILDQILGKNYIYQEYFDMKKVDFVEFDGEGQLQITPFASVIGLFIYGRRFQGLYTRIGNEALISGARRYYTTPNFLVTRK